MYCKEYDVGRLYCSDVRTYLERCKFKGLDIQYMESSGFLSRTFIVKGEGEDFDKVTGQLSAWVHHVNSEE